MMSQSNKRKKWIGHSDPNVFHLPFPYPWKKCVRKNPGKYFLKSLEKLLSENAISLNKDVCGFMLETFQGWGAIFYPKEYVKMLSIIAKRHNIKICFDEMQAGFGRTGKLFGYMHYGVEPDLICLGKGAASGLPLSIVLGRKEIMDIPSIGSMSSTHSANPLVCVAGKANLQTILEGRLIENSKNLGRILHTNLNRIRKRFPEVISNVLGKGLIAGIIFKDKDGNPLSYLCDRIAELCMQRGLLLVHTGRESIKIAPPLSINKEPLLEGIEVLEGAIEDVIEGSKKL